jgi:hypothetical protein
LCNCGCQDCPEEKDLAGTLLRVMSYYTIFSKYNNAYLQSIYPCFICSVITANECNLYNEVVLGNFDNTQIAKRLLALHYIAFLSYELGLVSTALEKEGVKKELKYDKIIKCIQAQGIDTSCIDNSMSSMSSFSILISPNQPATVGNYTLNVSNRSTTVLTTGMFTSLTTPPYSDPEGDSPWELRVDSLPNSGVLFISGNPVTIGQVIPFTAISTGDLTFVSPDMDAPTSTSFLFSVSDAGSLIFSN